MLKPLLAATYTGKHPIKFPIIGSQKIDGIRCIFVNGIPMTRSLKDAIKNDHTRNGLIQACGDVPFDGEIICGDILDSAVCSNTASGVMKKSGTPEWLYLVFDYAHPDWKDRPYSERVAEAARQVALINHPQVRMLPQKTFHTEEELFAYEDANALGGFEGTMFRTHDGPYKYGRSTEKENILVKIKRWEDCEAIILEVFEEQENQNEAKTNALGNTERSSHKENKVGKGTVGGYLCKTKRGIDEQSGLFGLDCNGPWVEFYLGAAANMKAEDRIALWEIRDTIPGRKAKLKYQKTEGAEAPRFPVFLLFREDE